MAKTQNIIAKISANIKKKKWKCLIQDCDETAINSHLIQRNGILNNIVSNGHLIEVKMVDAHKWNDKQLPFEFKTVGITKALSHKVFCNRHDTSIFKPIEDDNKDYKSYTAFILFSYRAVCAEIRKKMVNIELHTRVIKANTLTRKIDMEQIKLIIKGNKTGITDLNEMKLMLENEIDIEKNNYSYFVYSYDKLDIYASAVYSATHINLPKDERELDLKNIYIHIIPLVKETLIIIGYHNKFTSTEITKYCKSWDNLSQKELELKLTSLFANNIENWGLSIDLYKTIQGKNKRKYFKELKKNVNYFGLSKTSDFNLFETK